MEFLESRKISYLEFWISTQTGFTCEVVAVDISVIVVIIVITCEVVEEQTAAADISGCSFATLPASPSLVSPGFEII